jgi:hypothetical protein
MSDFDEVLERLVTDPGFQAALRANPGAALRGYQLDAQEWALLHEQVDLGDATDRTVEMRISKSGVFGMVGPVVSAFGMSGADGTPVFGRADPPTGSTPVFGLAQESDDGVTQTLGEAGSQTQSEPVLGVVDASGPPVPSGGTPATGYHTWVDAAGDGQGDAYVAVERGDGGVDILVDQDGDGAVDFVGHDYDRDGLVDEADYDTDHDGYIDTRMQDLNGDGWLDRRVPYQSDGQGTLGTAGPGK